MFSAARLPNCCCEGYPPVRGTLAHTNALYCVPMDGGGEGVRLRRVVPVVHRFFDDVWIVSVEIWDHCVVFRLGIAEAPPPPFRFKIEDWLLADDAGTSYHHVSGLGTSSRLRGFRYDAEFAPAPPLEATSLRIRYEATGGDVSISLMD